MAKKRVEYTPERDYVYTEKPTAPVWGAYRTPAERAAAQAASLKAANSPAAMRAREVAEATAQAEALREADRGTGWGAYRTPEERAAMIRAANNADKTVESFEPLNPHPLGAVDPIYQNQNNPTVRAAAQEAASNKPMVSEDIMNDILNRKPFSYNPNADALYQIYKDQYLTAGNIAMKDTMGKAAALTGGYGNTYAQTVGQQVYDDYAARAADKIPELEQLAYERWAREGDELRNNYSLLYGREQDADERAYRDRVLERQMFESDREYNFNVEKFGKEYALEVRSQDLAEKVANHEMSMDELRFVLDEKVANHEMSMDDARLIMEKAESEAKIDQIRADIDLGYRSDDREERELTARINNSYYSGGNPSENPSVSPSDTTDPELEAYKAKFTGSVKLDTDEKWASIVNRTAAAIRNGTFDESSLYKYTYEQAVAILDRAEALINTGDKTKANYRLNATRKGYSVK